MKFTMVIPSYWGRGSNVGWQRGNAIDDHPTPLDNEGRLIRAIQSTKILRDTAFQLVIIAVATAEDIETQVEEKVANTIKSALGTIGVEVSLFGPSHLNQVHELLINQGRKEHCELLKLQEYSNGFR